MLATGRKPTKARAHVTLALALSLAAVLGTLPPPPVQADLVDHQIIMISYDSITGLLTGTDRNGLPVATYLTSATSFRAAQLNKFQPTDPCKPLAGAYNTVQASGSVDASLQTAITNLATSSCGAKVNIDSTGLPAGSSPFLYCSGPSVARRPRAERT